MIAIPLSYRSIDSKVFETRKLSISKGIMIPKFTLRVKAGQVWVGIMVEVQLLDKAGVLL